MFCNSYNKNLNIYISKNKSVEDISEFSYHTSDIDIFDSPTHGKGQNKNDDLFRSMMVDKITNSTYQQKIMVNQKDNYSSIGSLSMFTANTPIFLRFKI